MACLVHLVLAASATGARFALSNRSDACLDRYYQECVPLWATCPEERSSSDCYPLVPSAILAAMKSGPGPLILFVPLAFLPFHLPGLSGVDPELATFWIHQLLSLATYGTVGALAFTRFPPRIAAILFVFAYAAATAVTTLFWVMWFSMI